MIDNERGKYDKTRGVASKNQTLLWRIVSRKKRTARNRCDRTVIVGAGLDKLVQDWYSLDRWLLVQEWFPLVQEDGRWFRTGIWLCRKMVAGPGLVVAGAELVAADICWCRKVVAGSGLVVAGAELVAAGICWDRKVIAGAGRPCSLWLLLIP